MMGLALYKVLAAGAPAWPVALFGIQLFLNILWSFAFFKWHDLTLALADILVLLAAIVATTSAFYQVDRTAGILMVPYLLWVTFATTLTARLYQLNPNSR